MRRERKRAGELLSHLVTRATTSQFRIDRLPILSMDRLTYSALGDHGQAVMAREHGGELCCA